MESFGERLKRLRVEAGLTQMELAKKSGIAQKSISNWEMNDKEPKISSLRKLCKALGVPSSTFVEETE